MFDISAFVQGFALGLGMFVCPGPKDVLILRQALFQRPATELLAVGVLSDALLIGLGMAGASAALGRAPALQTAALWLGVALMVGHGLLAARRAFVGAAGVSWLAHQDAVMTRGRSLAALLTVSLLNPVAWLDTVLVIGTYGAALPGAKQMSFAFGATSASFMWFLALVTGARSAQRLMTEPKAWQALDAFVAAAMMGLAAYVVSGLR
ncbi:LysE/ArgO family amino acid transporter [Rhodoferax ferrireducens]|uniref:LysE/ArgO family amino acid transporter n=1 Tax=Rhodoferax ferrireducens TaxID=192843 RepID=UPI000E0DFC50|nr:LysE family transporter [Rhodoferax ferrireducens]